MQVADVSSLPTFSVTSGPCTVTEGGACFRSPNYPDDYGSSQECEIAVSRAGFAGATAFDTVSVYDYVTIGGTQWEWRSPGVKRSACWRRHYCGLARGQF